MTIRIDIIIFPQSIAVITIKSQHHMYSRRYLIGHNKTIDKQKDLGVYAKHDIIVGKRKQPAQTVHRHDGSRHSPQAPALDPC